MGRPHKIKSGIKLTPSQKKVWNDPARFRILKCGRRWGKSYMAAAWLVKRALENPGRHWVCAKTLQLGVDEFWERFEVLLDDRFVVGKDRRACRFKIKVGNMRSELGIVSAEREDSLRGRGLASLVIDEAAFVTPSLFDVVLAPMLMESKAPVLIISSPKAGWFCNQWNAAARGDLGPDWSAHHYTVYDNAKSRGGIIDDKEIERTKSRTPENIWRSEYMAEEIEGDGTVYNNFSDANVFDPKERFQDYREWPTILGIDWGSRDCTGVGWLSVDPKTGYVVIGEEHERSGWEPTKHCDVIKRANRNYRNIRKHDYVLSHDAFRKGGDARTSIADDFARNDIFCKKSTKDVVATINLLRAFISGDNGTPWLYVANHCAGTIRHMQEWQWKTHEPDLLQGIRYALEEIRRRKMTPYANMTATYAHAIGDREISKSQAYSPSGIFLEKPKPKRRAQQWGWDYNYGAPL